MVISQSPEGKQVLSEPCWTCGLNMDIRNEEGPVTDMSLAAFPHSAFSWHQHERPEFLWDTSSLVVVDNFTLLHRSFLPYQP